MLPATSRFVLGIDLLELLKNPRCQPVINHVIRQDAEIAGALNSVSRIVHASQPEDLLIVVWRKRLHVSLQLFGDEGFEYVCERSCRPVSLMPRSFINKSNNSHSCEAAAKQTAGICNVLLVGLE